MKNFKTIFPDGNIRYKLANNFTYFSDTKRRNSSGSCVFAIDKGSKLSFRKINYSLGSKATLKPHLYLVFSIKNGKIIVYHRKRVTPNGEFSIKTLVSPREIRSIFLDLFSCKRKELKKSQLARTKSVFKKWAKKNKLKFQNSKNLFEIIASAMYPGLEPKYTDAVMGSFSIYLREPDLKSSIKKCFGNDGKIITSLVCQAMDETKSCEIFKVGIALRKIVSLDCLQSVLKTELNNYRSTKEQLSKLGHSFIVSNIEKGAIKYVSSREDVINFRKLISNYKEDRIKKLLYGDCSHFHDTFRMWKQLSYDKSFLPNKPKDLNEIHNVFSKEILKLGQSDYSLISKPIEIDGVRVGDFKLEIPKTYYELIDYGKKMFNCIPTYGPSMKSGDCLLMGVYKGEELVYNIMIREKYISQFYGKRNSIPEPIDKKLIESFLKEAKIISHTEEEVPF